jgi:hypothetical protein
LKKILAPLALSWGAAWLIAGIVLGALAYRKISFPVYFVLPLAVFGGVGWIPASLILLLVKTKTHRWRLGWTAIYITVIGLLIGGVMAWRDHYETPRNAGPYLVNSADPKTTMTVCWSAETEAPGQVDYTLEGASDWKTASCAATHYPKVRLEGLETGTAYRYRVPALGADEHVFRTAPAAPEDFSFAVYGDSHAGSISFHRSVLRAIEREEPSHDGFSLLFNPGDLVDKSGKGYGWQWHTLLGDIAPLAASRPYEVSMGNHDPGGTPECYGQFFDYGTPTHWRVLDYSGVRFIVLSTQDNLNPDGPQYNWLVKTLDSPPADTRFTVVLLHKPLVTYDPREHDNALARRGVLEPLFHAKGVDLVFAGHVHAYEHHRLSGFDHVITGGGGKLLWTRPVFGPETVNAETCWHFCAVDVRGKTMTVRAFRTDGTLLDTFEISSKETPLVHCEDDGRRTGAAQQRVVAGRDNS